MTRLVKLTEKLTVSADKIVSLRVRTCTEEQLETDYNKDKYRLVAEIYQTNGTTRPEELSSSSWDGGLSQELDSLRELINYAL